MGGWGFGVYFLARTECNISEFVPMTEIQTIGGAELHAVLRALYEVIMYTAPQ